MWQSLRRYIEKTLFQKERPGAHLKHGAKFRLWENREDVFSSTLPVKYN